MFYGTISFREITAIFIIFVVSEWSSSVYNKLWPLSLVLALLCGTFCTNSFCGL